MTGPWRTSDYVLLASIAIALGLAIWKLVEVVVWINNHVYCGIQ